MNLFEPLRDRIEADELVGGVLNGTGEALRKVSARRHRPAPAATSSLTIGS